MSLLQEVTVSARDNSASVGISMGSALAMILSYDRNHSIFYAIVHGLCTWFYVLYRVIWR
jgi:hypothetical protein